jgi:hypothetical protein
VSDQGPPSDNDPAPARAARPVKKVAKKRPAGSSKGSGGAPKGTKARASAKPSSAAAPPPIDDAKATTRGIAVIAVTVIVGLLIFWQGFSREAGETVAAGPSTTTIPGDVDRDAAPPTTAPEQGTTVPKTPVTRVPPDEISVIVANGVDPSQTIAGPQAAKLTAAGYPQPVTMDLPPPAVASSSVYYTGDMESEAQAIAVALGLPDAAVNPIPTPAPVPMNTAEILVIIGPDAPA